MLQLKRCTGQLVLYCNQLSQCEFHHVNRIPHLPSLITCWSPSHQMSSKTHIRCRVSVQLEKHKAHALESSVPASLCDSKGVQTDLKGVTVSMDPGGGGGVLTTGGGALLHLAIWVRRNWDNAAVNTPDGDLWVLWKFNVTLRATCTHWGQRWAQPGDGPRLPCVSTLETKCQ